MNKLVGFILIFGTIGGALLLGGKPAYFLDIPSLIFVLGIVLGALVWKFGVRGLIQSWHDPLFYELAQISSMTAGVLGPVIGIIHILHNFSDPQKLGPAVAVSLLTFLYAIIFNLIFILLKKGGSGGLKSKAVMGISFIGFFLCLSTVPILMMALS